jgi:chitinase
MKLVIFALCVYLSTAFIGSDNFLAASPKMFVGYFESWSEKWANDGNSAKLANLPSYVNVVNLAFMKPEGQYSGNLNIGSTGLSFPYDGKTLKTAITALKKRNPGTKVLISVGGATFTNWGHLNEGAIAHFVKDFGLDGVDVDYEPTSPACSSNNGQVSCRTDQEFINVIKRVRAVLPRPYIVSIAGFSIGAYGQGNFKSASPQGDHTGVSVNMLKSVGNLLDWIHIMSYDAGNSFNPETAFWAYKSLFSGKITIGIEIPPEAWGGHVYTMSQVGRLGDFVNNNGGSGLMVWSLHQKPKGNVNANNPNARMVAQSACRKFGLGNYQADLNV